MYAAILSFFDWKIWTCILLFIIFFLWVFWGGKNHRMIGLSPLDTRQDLKEALGSEDYQRRKDDLSEHPGSPVEELVDDPDEVETGSMDVKKIVRKIRDRKSGDIANITTLDTTPAIPRELLEVKRPRKDIDTRQPVNKRHSKKEEVCRKILEEMYHLPFPSVRPEWLRNPETGYPLEIDCYNDELKLGLECNGEQHYVWPNFTGQTLDQFKAQVRRDIFKVDRCDQNGVYLITIPYSVPNYMLKDYIKYYSPEEVISRLAK